MIEKMFCDFDEVFKDYKPDKPDPPSEYEEMVCGQGCLCCACVNKNPNINKDYHDEVLCIQSYGKCIKIKKVVYERKFVDF